MHGREGVEREDCEHGTKGPRRVRGGNINGVQHTRRKKLEQIKHEKAKTCSGYAGRSKGKSDWTLALAA